MARWPVLVLALSATLALSFVVVSAVFFVWPATDRPQHVDAIVSLNGRDETSREQTAVSLARRGYAPFLLFSQGAFRTTPCPSVPRVVVVCFEPSPARTVGEVEFASRYARARGWHSLLIVPGQAQVTRARVLLRRCFSGRIVVAPAPIPLRLLVSQVFYEWGAMAKALIWDRHC